MFACSVPEGIGEVGLVVQRREEEAEGGYYILWGDGLEGARVEDLHKGRVAGVGWYWLDAKAVEVRGYVRAVASDGELVTVVLD